jgi:hypothetical protein
MTRRPRNSGGVSFNPAPAVDDQVYCLHYHIVRRRCLAEVGPARTARPRYRSRERTSVAVYACDSPPDVGATRLRRQQCHLS